MNRIAQFEKVSYEQFLKDYIDAFGGNVSIASDFQTPEEIYNAIQLPKRATNGSAGYDFHSTVKCTLEQGNTIKIPTGIRVRIEDGWVLKVYPRSGLGFKYRLQLDNTVGIIDSDYYYSDNEGHIFIKITNDSKPYKVLQLNIGDAMAQGIFVEYGITYDDNVDTIRNGGFGSTGK